MEALEGIEAGMEALEEMEAEGTQPWEMDLTHEDPQQAAVDLDQNCLIVCQETEAGMEALEMEAEETLPWEMDLTHEDPQLAAVDQEQSCLRVCQDTKLVSLVVQDS